jgi:hypothetical protein
MVSIRLTVCAAIALASTAMEASAQDCRGCARYSKSAAACIVCVKQWEGDKHSLSARQAWCGKNQPLCYKGETRPKGASRTDCDTALRNSIKLANVVPTALRCGVVGLAAWVRFSALADFGGSQRRLS